MLEIIALVTGVPTVLMLLLVVLGRMESSFVRPPERAAAMTELLATSDDPEAIERAAERLCAEAVPAARRPHRHKTDETDETDRREPAPSAEASPTAA